MHVLSVTNGVTDNLPVSDKIITLASDETYEPLLQVTAVACENPIFPVTISGITVEIHQYPVDINQYPIENPQNSGATNEEVATSPGLHPHFKTIFASFHNYMCNVEAVSKARPEMYVLGACQVMEAVGMDLACLTRLCVRKRFLEHVQDNSKTTEMKKISIKTLRNKLKFLLYFSKYLLSDNCRGWVTDTWRVEIEKLREDIPWGRQSLRRPCTAEELQRCVLDGQEAVTPADIKKYRESEYSLVATKILQERCEMPNATPSVSDFLRCRNHMIVVISTANAHGSGVLCNLTTADYENGLRSQGKEDGSRCFKIVDQKTATTHGTANIAVGAEEAQLPSYYMTMRNKLDVENIAPYVFVNSIGTKMSPSNIGSALTCTFGRSGYNERVTCSKLRKTAVTEIHTKYPDKKGDIAAHMCHMETTRS